MGSGMTVGVQAAVRATSVDELHQMLTVLPTGPKDKLDRALREKAPVAETDVTCPIIYIQSLSGTTDTFEVQLDKLTKDLIASVAACNAHAENTFTLLHREHMLEPGLTLEEQGVSSGAVLTLLQSPRIEWGQHFLAWDAVRMWIRKRVDGLDNFMDDGPYPPWVARLFASLSYEDVMDSAHIWEGDCPETLEMDTWLGPMLQQYFFLDIDSQSVEQAKQWCNAFIASMPRPSSKCKGGYNPEKPPSAGTFDLRVLRALSKADEMQHFLRVAEKDLDFLQDKYSLPENHSECGDDDDADEQGEHGMEEEGEEEEANEELAEDED